MQDIAFTTKFLIKRSISQKKKHTKQNMGSRDFSIMPIRNKISCSFKENDGWNWYLSFCQRSRSQWNDLRDKETKILRHDGFVWLVYHFKYIIIIEFTLIYIFAYQSQAENWLYLFLNIEHKMKLPNKFQLPITSEALHVAPTLTFLLTTYINVTSDIMK